MLQVSCDVSANIITIAEYYRKQQTPWNVEMCCLRHSNEEVLQTNARLHRSKYYNVNPKNIQERILECFKDH